MRPTTYELLRGIRDCLDTVIAPDLASPWPKAMAATMGQLLDHLMLREQGESLFLADDIDALRDLLSGLPADLAALSSVAARVQEPLDLSPDAPPPAREALLTESEALRSAVEDVAASLVHENDADPAVREARTRVNGYLRQAIERESRFAEPLGGDVDAPGAATADTLAFEAQRIAAYLRYRLPGAEAVAVANLVRLPGGFRKETQFLDASWGEAGQLVNRAMALRKDLAQTMADLRISREHRIFAALAGSGVPVPRMYWLEEDPSWLGAPFCLEERVPGGSGNGARHAEAATRRAIGQQLAAILGRLHALDYRERGLDFLGVSGSRAEGATQLVDQWERHFRTSQLQAAPILVQTFAWLRQNAPKEIPPVAFVHGDPGLHNLLIADGAITALLGFDFAHIGDPSADIAACQPAAELLMPWEEFLAAYRAAGGAELPAENVHYYAVLTAAREAVACAARLYAFCTGTNLQLDLPRAGIGRYRELQGEIAKLTGF